MTNCRICLDPRNCDCLCTVCSASRIRYQEFQLFISELGEESGLGKNNVNRDAIIDEVWISIQKHVNTEHTGCVKCGGQLDGNGNCSNYCEE